MTNIVKFPTARPSSDDDLEGLFDDPPDDLIVRCNPNGRRRDICSVRQ